MPDLVPPAVGALADEGSPGIPVTGGAALGAGVGPGRAAPRTLHRVLGGEVGPLLVDPAAVLVGEEGQEAPPQAPRLPEPVRWDALPRALGTVMRSVFLFSVFEQVLDSFRIP